MLSLRQLLTPVSEDDLLAFFLDVLNSLGFQATGWQSNSAARTLTQLFARVTSDLTFSIADIVAGGFAGLAKGPYADMLGQYTFNLTRILATPTLGQMVLTSNIAAPVHTWADGELLIADAAQGSGANTYTVDSIGVTTLNPGTSIAVFVRAAVPGSAANRLAPNSPALQLWTPLVGVTVSNPPNPPTTPANTWITQPGTDNETDGPGGRYNARMIGRWDRLAYGNTDGSYTAWVLQALPAVTRLSVRAGSAPEIVHIVAATALGGIDAGQITTILNYLNGVTDGVGRRPLNDVPEVVSANQVTAPPLVLKITVQSAFSADAVSRVSAALVAFQGSLPIGGKRIGLSGTGKILLADLYKTVMAQQGILDVDFSLTADVPLGQDDIYVAVPAVSMVIQP